jgi:hypothetical protein
MFNHNHDVDITPRGLHALSLWHQIHFVYRPPTYQVVYDQQQVYW